MGCLNGLCATAVVVLLLGGCAPERTLGPQLFEELLPVRLGTSPWQLTDRLNRQPLISDSLGLVFKWKRSSGERVRLEAYGLLQIEALVANFTAQTEDSCLAAYQALESVLREQLGLPISGSSGNYAWHRSTQGDLIVLRLLPDKKRLTLQLLPAPPAH
jgi:hypothetical protein